ncbi:MAG: MobF family relaxase [Acidimicrobiia bacterium]|nr:MobF family relaxase [Acidimicrobiia bacterium]
MLSIAKAHKDYYLQKLSEITPREDYYLRGGTATGRWHGSGALEQGLKGTVSTEGLVRLFDGQHPMTGEKLGRQLRKDGVAAWDLTFSADKSVSLLWAFGDDEVRRHVVEAFEESTAEAVAYLESVASSTRGASRTPVVDREGKPILDDDGRQRHRIETWPIRTTGYVSAWFTEFTSRADDPQLHTHVVVGNRVKGVDGAWRAIDGRLLYRHKLAAGYLHEAELRHRLTDRLGVRWQPVRNGVADIEGFSREQIMVFSQRRQAIEEWRNSHGYADTAAANEVATLATRSPKQDHPIDNLMPVWLERGAGIGITPETVAAVLDRSREVTVPDPDPIHDRMASAGGLTAQASTFGRGDAIKAAAEALPEGGRRSDVEALADTFLRRSDVVPILPIHPTSDALSDLPIELDPAELARLLELVNSTKPPTMRRRDGDVFPGLVNERRYTTTELLTIEQRIIDRAQNGIAADRWTAREEKVEAALAAHPDLTGGQRAMVHQFTGSGNAIDIGVGAAGTGKTTVMAIIGELATETETPVVGTALAARAAAGFETATGIPSTTLTRFLWETKAAGGLPTGAIVVVDEAGMVGSRQLADMSDLVEEASGKLILIGDHHQLAEIDAGGLFAGLTARLPAVELTENVRQDQEWERSALVELRHGSISRAVAMYNRRGKINVAASNDDTITQAVDAWYRDLQEIGDPAQVLLIGHRNTTVNQLNRQARARIAESGLLHGPTVSTGDRILQAGDRAVCLKNRTRLGVLNGDLGTVTAVDTEWRTVTLRLDRNDNTVTVPHWYLDDGHLDWGYALTGHKAQGATARRAHTVAGDGVDREWIYVTLSRGREANTIYLTNPELDDGECLHLARQPPDRLPSLIAALGRSAAEPAAIDTGRGPRILTDEQLNQRLADPEWHLRVSRGPWLADDIGDSAEPLVEYLATHREARARHRDHLAAIAYEPPQWIVNAIGERPTEPDRRVTWDLIVDHAVSYRAEHAVADQASGLLGPQPEGDSIAERVAWAVANTNVERGVSRLNLEGRNLESDGGRSLC